MKTILIPFRDDEPAHQAVEAGCRVAHQFGAYIEGLFIQTPPLVYASEGIAIGGYVTQLADEERRRADEAKAKFVELMSEHAIEVTDADESDVPAPVGASESANAVWRQVDGLGEQIVGEYGRLFDLVVIGRETKDSSPDWSVMCESSLFDSGRVLLLAPPIMPETAGEVLTILWNGSTETARTITMTMPFLSVAKKVIVLTVEGATVPGPSGEQVAEMLIRNGINASAKTTELAGRSTGVAVLEDAYETGADMLVKGAYAHSRLRQMIFGGPTRQILTSTELPVLMAH